MLKARRKDPTEQLKFPEPREGLPEDPRPFLGSAHFVAAAAVQEHLSAHCVVAVVGRLGSGKSTVCRRAANSRWARQWYLHDENGQPVHRRFWVDLEDSSPGAETEQRVARAVGRSTFADALARIGNGKPCLLVLDNADQAFVDGDQDATLAQLVGCADQGASVIVTRRQISGLGVDRPWDDVVELSGFATDDEARQLFGVRAPQHAADFRVAQIVAACDRLPLAVNLLACAAAGADLELARLRVGPGIQPRSGLDFAIEVSAAMLDPEARLVWGALSLLPSGLSEADITEVLAAYGDARERSIRLFALGVAQRCEAGLRIPVPLRLARSLAALPDAAVSDLWGSYVRRAQGVVGPVPASMAVFGGGTGTASSTGRSPANATKDANDARPRPEGSGRRGRTTRASRVDAEVVDAWLARQTTTLTRLASWPSRPDTSFDLACAGLLVHRSGTAPDILDRVLVRLVEGALAVASSPPAGSHSSANGGVLSPTAASGTATAPAPAATPPAATATATAAATAAAATAPAPPATPPPVTATAPTATAPAPTATTAFPATAWSSDDGEIPRAAQAAQIAAALEDQRRFGTAALIATAVVEAHRRAGDLLAMAAALCQLGRAERFCAQYQEAETHLLEARRLFEDLDDGVGQGCAMFELGQVELDLGRLDDAERDLGEALVLFEAHGRPVGAANANLDLVRVDLARGRADGAERRLGEAMDRYEAAGDRLGFANACLQLGQVELARAELDSAERRFAGALDGYEQAGDKLGFANACLQLGQVELARGRLVSAERRFAGALAGYQRVGDKVGLANASLQLGQIDLARGGLDQAGPRLLDALTAYEDLGDRIGVAHASLQLGQVALGRGELALAERRLGAAQVAYDDSGDRMGSANSRHVAALLLEAQRHDTHAMAMFGEAARLYSSLGRTASAGWSLAGAARTCSGKAERMGYAADAVRLLQEAGLADAASLLAVQLAERERPPEPKASVVPESVVEAEPPAEAPSSAWPAVAPAVDPVPAPASAPAGETALPDPDEPPPADDGFPSVASPAAPPPESPPETIELSAAETWTSRAADPHPDWLPPWSPGVERALLSSPLPSPLPPVSSSAAPGEGTDSWSPSQEPPAPAPTPARAPIAEPARGFEQWRWSEGDDSSPTPVAGQPAVPPWSAVDDTAAWTPSWSTAPEGASGVGESDSLFSGDGHDTPTVAHDSRPSAPGHKQSRFRKGRRKDR